MIKDKQSLQKAFIGKWRIIKMSEWDADFIDAEVKAYIKIDKNGTGDFQFGYVTGDICGEFLKKPEGIIFDFTWDGSDELDPAAGDGWMKIISISTAEGEIRFHEGDKSYFWARKIK